MSTHDAYQAVVTYQAMIVYRHTTWVPSQAWSGLIEYAYAYGDSDLARELQFEWDQGERTIRLVRRFNGRDRTYQVRTVSVDAKGNRVNVAL